MIYHSGNRKLYDDWQSGDAEVTRLTKPWPNPEEIMFATHLLDRDNISWFIGMNGSRYEVCRTFIKSRRDEYVPQT